jgi:hypothetical protein
VVGSAGSVAVLIAVLAMFVAFGLVVGPVYQPINTMSSVPERPPKYDISKTKVPLNFPKDILHRHSQAQRPLTSDNASGADLVSPG